MNQKQIYTPYLSSFEYIPDGEPHVFGNRIYLYGSHDRFRGAGFCLNVSNISRKRLFGFSKIDDGINWKGK